MIVTVEGLKRARERWMTTGRSRGFFDHVITVLDSAATNADVMAALRNPAYTIQHSDNPSANGTEAWVVLAEGEPIVAYTLHERRRGDADVAILGDIPSLPSLVRAHGTT